MKLLRLMVNEINKLMKLMRLMRISPEFRTTHIKYVL